MDFFTLHWSINPKPLDHDISSSQKIQWCVLLLVSLNSKYVTWVVPEILEFQKICSASAHTKIPKYHLFHAYLVNNSKTNRPWHFFFWGNTEVHLVVIHCEQQVFNLGSFRDIGGSKSLLSSSSDVWAGAEKIYLNVNNSKTADVTNLPFTQNNNKIHPCISCRWEFSWSIGFGVIDRWSAKMLIFGDIVGIEGESIFF